MYLLCSINMIGHEKESVEYLSKKKITPNYSITKIKDAQWIKSTTVNNVDFYHQIVTCGNKKAVLLRFENKNNFNVEVSWKELITIEEQFTSDSKLETKTLIINPGITEPSSCSDNSKSLLIILATEVNPTFGASINGFNFEDIKIKELN